MKRALTIAATTTTALLISAGSASAQPKQPPTPLKLAQSVQVVIDCTYNDKTVYFGCDPHKQHLSIGRVMDWTATSPRVKKICREHKAYTHAWRVGFCAGKTIESQGKDVRDETVIGIIARAWWAEGYWYPRPR